MIRIALAIAALSLVVALKLAPGADAATNQAAFNGGAYCAHHSLYPRIVGYPAPMHRTPGFSGTAIIGGPVDPSSFAPSTPRYGNRYGDQWLFFRVLAWYIDGAGNWRRLDGRWLAGQGEMGPHTSGLFQYVEMTPGKGDWRQTGQINSRSPEDMSGISLSAHGNYYLQMDFRWGSIQDLTNGRTVYAGDSALVEVGWTYC
jgi:hypothetical protein